MSKQTVADVVATLERAYPPALAESWDSVGLICGDPAEPASHVAFALDCTDEVADAAIAAGADMLVVHHPLLMRGVTGVPTSHPKGRIVHKLIRNHVALYAAHTNADSSRPGVNDILAELLGVSAGAPLRPIPEPIDKWGFTVPTEYAEETKSAVFAAGAGQLGAYDQAGFQYNVVGQFRPSEDSNPHSGDIGNLSRVEELRIEFIAPKARRHAVRAALFDAHPYEEVAYDIVESHTDTPNLGIGRVGKLDTPMTLADFTKRVADRLPATIWGVRAAGDPDRMVHTVAVASGAGDSFLDQVAKMDVDCFVTSDLRHHPVDEHLRAGGCPVIDTAHWASEFPWCAVVAGVVKESNKVATTVIDVRTDPWTLHEHSTDGYQGRMNN